MDRGIKWARDRIAYFEEKLEKGPFKPLTPEEVENRRICAVVADQIRADIKAGKRAPIQIKL